MHPMLTLLATRPHLLVDHAQAYGALLQEELGLAGAAWQRQFLLQVAVVCFLGVTTVLAGMAIMLWVTVGVTANATWMLVVIPVFSFLIAVVCLLLALRPNRPESFANLSRQINADMALLHAAGTP